MTDKNGKTDNYSKIRALIGAGLSFLLMPFAFAGLLEAGAGFLSHLKSFGLGLFCLACGLFFLHSYIRYR